MIKKNQKNQKKIVLLDSHAIIHRAYHALPDFMNSKGEPTGAIYGLATMLFKIITELQPDYLVACYDLPKKTFRHEAYSNYKAGRVKIDEALIYQLSKSKDFFKACSIPIYECEGFEADDLLGTIVEQNKDKIEMDIIIASGDMDTLQLVKTKNVFVYTLKKGINDTILYDQKSVLNRFGFKSEYLPDYKGLRGDPSDNIIGIKGIGDKTATILIKKYSTLEKMYQQLKKDEKGFQKLGITKRVIDLLKEGEEEAFFSKTLATIRSDAPINFELPSKNWKQVVEKEKVNNFFKEVEFKSLQNRFLNLLEKKEDKDQESFSQKTETEIIQKQKTFFIKEEEKEKITKAKIAFWLLNSEKTNPSLEEILDFKKSHSLDEVLSLLEEDIKKENLDYVYRNIEIPIISIVQKMEERGILIDQNYLKEISKEYHTQLKKLEKEIWKLTAEEFNINSPKQLSQVLFEKLKLSVKGIKKSAGGALSTKESELEKLKDFHPAIKKILEYRELQKLLSTYIDSIPKMIQADGFLHASFIQTGTTTGRFASNNPNLQNIPIKTEKGKKIRNAFLAPPGYLLASFDYSQIELRIAALMSQDSYFLKVFKEKKDIHAAVAAKVFNVPEIEITAEMRRRAKIINFGILYGMGVNALRQNLETDRKEAQAFYDNYFLQFPTIADYLQSIKDFALKNGYTQTLFGRKRYFPGLRSPVPYIRAMSERMAINAPIQGTATADIIKIGMKKVEEELKKVNLLSETNLVLQVHDELVFEIKKNKISEISQIIKKAMKNVIPQEFLVNLEPVSLEVSCKTGVNWGELE